MVTVIVKESGALVGVSLREGEEYDSIGIRC